MDFLVANIEAIVFYTVAVLTVAGGIGVIAFKQLLEIFECFFQYCAVKRRIDVRHNLNHGLLYLISI